MLIRAGKLNERPLVEKLEQGEIGAVELSVPAAYYLKEGSSQSFTPAFAAAVVSRYRLAFKEPLFSTYIYVPKSPAPPL